MGASDDARSSQSEIADRQYSGFTTLDYVLYATTVLSWSASWYALALQPGVVANEVSLIYRFFIAAVIMLIWVFVSRRKLSFSLFDHAGFALLGICIFSTNFLLFYYGSVYLVSGLLSVVFSLASLYNIFLAAVIFRERPSGKVVLAGVIGFTGIGLLFWPEIRASDPSSTGSSANVLFGIALCMAGTLMFSLGNLVSSRLQKKEPRIPLVSMNAWGMVYGLAWLLVLALLQGKSFNYDPRLEYSVSLIFLALVSTVIAFAAYLTLVGRIGSGRAGYATVVFPVIALAISTALEGYQWGVLSVIGLVMVLGGNILIVRR